ncbi:hypothetical protein [Clostridium aminobutyricum]|uniref:Uncharacterized protein n=1 Tax=Clostridium aminobutyricum TaxID=33953 RepID=A0A939D9M9_CLOAM|nr:hypothetical protein [Clostridium aminobutyricum]MBN7773268.1 hypothetical protein [Clostridium aminobutyricum]
MTDPTINSDTLNPTFSSSTFAYTTEKVNIVLGQYITQDGVYFLVYIVIIDLMKV